MRQPKREKLDGIDHEHITRMLGSPGWQLVRERLERALRLKVEDLVLPHTEADTAMIRGYIGGVKLALEVPGILLREAKEKQDDGKHEL